MRHVAAATCMSWCAVLFAILLVAGLLSVLSTGTADLATENIIVFVARRSASMYVLLSQSKEISTVSCSTQYLVACRLPPCYCDLCKSYN